MNMNGAPNSAARNDVSHQVSVAPFLHCFHESFTSTDVLAAAKLTMQGRCDSPIAISIPG